MDQDSIMKAVTYAIIAIVVIFVIRYLLKKETFANEHHHHHHEHKHHSHKHNHHHSKGENSQPDEMYGVGGQNKTIWRTELPCVDGKCQWTEIPGNLKYISNGEFDIWGTGTNNWGSIFRCDKPCTGNWITVPGSLASVSVGKDMVYGVNDNGNVYQCPHTKEAPCTGQWTETNGWLGPGGIVSV